MSDFYTEQLVKKTVWGKGDGDQSGLIVLTVIAVFIVLMFPLGSSCRYWLLCWMYSCSAG